MTSTPHTKSQAVFSPPKSYQVGQTVAILIVHHFIFVPGVSFLPFNEQTLVQGSYGPWKTQKVTEFYHFILQERKVMEFDTINTFKFIFKTVCTGQPPCLRIQRVPKAQLLICSKWNSLSLSASHYPSSIPHHPIPFYFSSHKYMYLIFRAENMFSHSSF